MTKRNSPRLVTVNADPKLVNAAVPPPEVTLTMSTIQPGLLVDATVFKIMDTGLILNFLDIFYGSVDFEHLSEPASESWAQLYPEGTALKARVTFVSHSAKRIALSLRPHLVSARGFTLPAHISLGMITPMTVVRIDPNLGLLMRIDAPEADAVMAGADGESKKKKKKSAAASGPLFGHCHVSHTSDAKTDSLSATFKVGAVHQGRVLFAHTLDGLVHVSLRPSVLEQSILRHEDAIPGMEVQGEVIQIAEVGLIVRLTPRVTALCPHSHLSDVAGKKVAAKFKVGQKLNFRVWDVKLDTQPKKITLTLKKTLLTSGS